MNTLTKKITANVGIEEVWNLLFIQFAQVSKYNPLITGSRFDSGPEGGVGSVRSCDLNGNTTIKEKIVSAKPFERFDFAIVEGAMPMVASMNASYSLLAINEWQTEISFTVNFVSRPRFMGGIMKIMMGKKFMRMLAGLRQYLETGKQVTPGA